MPKNVGTTIAFQITINHRTMNVPKAKRGKNEGITF